MPVLFSRRRKRFDNSSFFCGGMRTPSPIDQVGELLQFDIRHLRDADDIQTSALGYCWMTRVRHISV